MPAGALVVNELGSNEVVSIRQADFVNSQNVRMIKRRGGASFLLKATEAISIGRELFAEQLECGLSAQLCIFGKVYLAHATGAQLLENAVM